MKKLYYIFLGLMFCIIWQYIASNIIETLGYPYENPEGASVSLTYLLFYCCIFAPIWEEAVFRYGAITLAQAIGEKAVVPMIVISSCIFGWIHHYNPESVLMQGGLGFILSYIYLKSNNSYFSVVIVHGLYNLFIIFLEIFKNSLSLF